MVYTLKAVIDTWLKQSTAQGAALPDNQRQFLKAETILPVVQFELAANDHLKVTLGQNAQGQPMQFQNRNVWFVYRPAVQFFSNGQLVTLPNAPAPSLVLKSIRDTWLKQSTAQSTALPDSQRQFFQAGTVLPLESYAAAENAHLKVTLGRDAQGNQVRFQGRNTWFVYRPAVQILQNGRVIVSPDPVPAPTPRPIPKPTPMPTPSTTIPADIRNADAIKTIIDTWLKLSTAQGSALTEDQRQFISAGTVLPIASAAPVENNHLKITLGKDSQGNQIQYKGRNTWFIYRPAIQLIDQKQPAPAPVPSTGRQRMNDKGIRLLKAFEGLRLQAYQDSVGVWTIGYGTTANVRPGMVITEAQAEELMRRDLNRFERAVDDLVTVPLNSDQFSALVSFAYNVGEGALASSTLLRLLNQRNYQGAADQFLRWDKAGGRALAGLTRRRRAERALFLGQDYTAFL